MIKIQIVNITFEDLTKAVAKRDLNTIMCFDTFNDIAYKEASSLKSFLGTDITESDTIYSEVLMNIFAQQPQNVAVFGKEIDSNSETVEESVFQALNEVADKNVFYIVTNSTDISTATAIAKWCTANGKIFAFTPDYSATPEEVIEMATQWNSGQNIVLPHVGEKSVEGTKQYNYASAMLGLMAPKQAGSATWFAKSPVGVPANYFSTEDATTYINSKCVNIYVDMLGTGANFDGRSTDETFADITVSKFYLRYRLEEALIRLFLTRDKIPFTNAGQTLIKNSIMSVIDQAGRNGILVTDETDVYIPNPLDLPENDRANRTWTGIEISTRLQGSAHGAEVKFVLNI